MCEIAVSRELEGFQMSSLRFVVALTIGAAAFAQESITEPVPDAKHVQRILQQFAQGSLTLEPNRGKLLTA